MQAPGRGLKGAKYDEMSRDNKENWSSSIYLQSKIGKALLESNFLINANSRVVEYNWSKIRNSELTNLANVIWLIPQNGWDIFELSI